MLVIIVEQHLFDILMNWRDSGLKPLKKAVNVGQLYKDHTEFQQVKLDAFRKAFSKMCGEVICKMTDQQFEELMEDATPEQRDEAMQCRHRGNAR